MSDLHNIETFEYDISDEVKKKEASIGSIASASGNIENKPEPKISKGSTVFIILSIIFLFLSIAGVVWYMMLLSNKNNAPVNTVIKNNISTNTHTDLQNILPSLDGNIGRFVSKIEITPTGYDLTLTDYKQVFAFVIKNENLLTNDSAKLFNIELSASSTRNFIDKTIMTQNMRVLNNASSTIAYAFINTNHLVLSTSTEGIISMRNAIIK